MQRQKQLTTLSYFATFIAMGIAMASLGPTLPALAEKTQSSIGAIGILFTARGLGSLIGSLWGGYLYDRLRGHIVMALTLVCTALLVALTPVAPVLWLLTAIMFFTGASQGILNIGGNALLVWVHGSKVGPFMNAMHFCFGLGTFISPIIVAQFVTRADGLLWTYLLIAVVNLPVAAIALLPSPPPPHVTQDKTNGKTDPVLILLISLVFACYVSAGTTFSGWITTYALKMDLANEAVAAYLASIYGGALMLGRLLAIPLAIRFRPRLILWVDFAGALVSLLAMLIWPGSLTAVIVTSAGFGLTLASIYPTTMSLAGELMPLSGKVTGLFSVAGGLGSMLMPWLIGQLFDSAGPQSMVLILMASMLLALGVLAVLARRPSLQPATQT